MIAQQKQIAVYTAVFGRYDRLHTLPRDPSCDYICFTDTPDLKSETFEIRHQPRQFSHPARDARYCKILSHAVLPDYRYTLWLDASASLRFENVSKFVKEALGDRSIAMHAHPSNDDIYRELERCVRYCKDDKALMAKQVARYESEGYPKQSGLVASGVIVRDASDSAIPKLEKEWWKEVEQGSYRDQLSFNYVAWKCGVPYATFDSLQYVPNSNPEFVSKYFEFWLHRGNS